MSFQKFIQDEQVNGASKIKSKSVRDMRKGMIESYGEFVETHIDGFMAKSADVFEIKTKARISLFAVEKEIICFQVKGSEIVYPTLKLLHKFPDILPRMTVDAGAIRFVLKGAHIMCPGLTSPGATMVDVEKGTPVAIYAEGKEHALAIGLTTLSTSEIREKNAGVGITMVHYLKDGLWCMDLSGMNLN